MVFPDRERFLYQASEGGLVPVWTEFHADLETPVSAYLKVAKRFPTDHFLLESVEGGEKWARFSFIGFDPHARFLAGPDGITVCKGGDTRTLSAANDPLEALAALLKEIRYQAAPGLPKLSGGAVGYISYDYVRYLEKVGGDRPPSPHPDAMFLFPSRLVIFDNVRHTILIVAHVEASEGRDLSEAYDCAVEAVREVREILRSPLAWSDIPEDISGEYGFEVSREGHMEAVERVKEYIRNGDIIQAVLSNRATVKTNRSEAEAYRVLRALNPSPYMYLLKIDKLSVVGSSPEVLVRLEGNDIQLRPIAGTRPRGADPEEDRRLEADLLSDPKEIAEHMMLVDLGRNDVGRVAEWGTVKANELMAIERYSNVMHIVSNVVGKLREGLTAFDVLRAAFPAGTVSGAPKVRAMQIISELEPFRRGIYAGAVGYFDPQGNMDFCIAIRTIVMREGVAKIQAGGGIVADSDPEREWEEILNKSRILFKAAGVSLKRETV
ncbi:MAG: anthranilate synthase component I [Syntrophorhabdaceae bacterium]|nr:anthranilate synthase component I [Syntrophorhabdaceae bacterium]